MERNLPSYARAQKGEKLPIDDVVVMLPVEECVDVSWPVMPVAGCICATLPAAKIILIIT